MPQDPASAAAVVPVSSWDFHSLLLDAEGHWDWEKAMGLFQGIVDYLAPLFLIASPVTSYADQILSIHRSKTSAGFSLDIPLIMLVASILKVFYWFGEHYDTALLVQALLMIGVQLTLLKVALDNRSPNGEKNGIHHIPFAGHRASPLEELLSGRRPYDFWRWPNSKSYFVFLGYFAGTLAGIQILLPFIAYNATYVAMLGYVGLAIEATLPLPQIWKNYSARSCRGFRLSVIINWLAGDTMKMMYFFGASEPVPWPFKLCGMFQAACDCYLGLQFWMYGTGGPGLGKGSVREVEMPTMGVVTGKSMLG